MNSSNQTEILGIQIFNIITDELNNALKTFDTTGAKTLMDANVEQVLSFTIILQFNI